MILIHDHLQLLVEHVYRSLQSPLFCHSNGVLFFTACYSHDFRFTSIFLACKVEEHHIDVEDFSNRLFSNIPTELLPSPEASSLSEVILRNELIVLEAVGFHLHVYHPYRCLYGFLAHIMRQQVIHLFIAQHHPSLFVDASARFAEHYR